MSAERAFLHGLNNRLAIAYGNAKILIKKLNRSDASPEEIEEFTKRVNKIIDSIEGATQLIAERRLDVIRREKEAV